MIDLCISHSTVSKRALGQTDFIEELEAQGLTFRRVEAPSSEAVCLWFTSFEDDALRSVGPEVRSGVVVVAEGATPPMEQAEQARRELGLLGLVEPDAWHNWQRGLLVAWGLYGEEEVATAAALTPVDGRGLQPLQSRETLTTMLARFLSAAETSRSQLTHEKS